MDWNLCIVCQKHTRESLSCPQATSKYNPLDVYKEFVKNVAEFQKLDALPVNVSFIDQDREGQAENFMSNKACWHRSCHQKFNNSKLERETTRKRKLDAMGTDSEVGKVSRPKRHSTDNSACMFCVKISSENLREFSTFSTDKSLRQMATEMQDTETLSKISGGDLIAIEAKYHLTCLVNYRNKYRSFLRAHSSSKSDDRERNKARAFAELVAYMETSLQDGTYLFKLSELHYLYEERLKELHEDIAFNKSRLKEKLLDYFAKMDLQQQTDGRNTILVFPEGMQQMLKDALHDHDYENEAILFAKVAKIAREELLSVNTEFAGCFEAECQQRITPITNLLISMIMYGPNIEGDVEYPQACLTVSQLLFYNCKKKQSKRQTADSRHSLKREPPLPLYIGLNLHTQTRSRKLIDQMSKLGICSTYDRICQVENNLALSVCQQFESEGVVCPTNLRKGIFTVGALDNIDHNPSSTTAEGSFHGTGISITQFPTQDTAGIGRVTSAYQPDNPLKQKPSLPESYTNVSVIQLNQAPTVPEVTSPEIQGHLEPAKEKEQEWIDHSLNLLQLDKLEKGQALSWAAYHASLQSTVQDPCAITALLPLFLEKADSPAMVKHGMDILKGITELLNHGQIPVLACDCPIFAVCKKIQWNFPQTHGEDKFVIMFGGLHLEKGLWTSLGKLLDGSGWTDALTESEVATSGSANSFLNVSHITRTRHMHQVTAMALAKLQQEAFQKENPGLQEEESYEVWRLAVVEKSPTFRFWDLILRTEILILIFIRAHREKNFQLYVESLENLMFLFFAMDQYNYCRWVSVHLRDMKSLPANIKDEFQKFWVVPKTLKRFSAIPIDQAHEQENAKVKGSGGAVGLTENPTALSRWLIAGPEQARLITQFERQYIPDADPEIEYEHHEEGLSSQERFLRQVKSLLLQFNEYGNPFEDQCSELLVLHNRECVDDEVVASMRKIKTLGTAQYEKFKKDVFQERSVPINGTIKKNSLPRFTTSQRKPRSQAKMIKAIRHDVGLFGRLYISNQHRAGDPDVFFAHENQPYPPSLADFGKLRLGTKSDLLKQLEDTSVNSQPKQKRDCKIIDGGVLIHILTPNCVRTFAEYADVVFLPSIKRELEKVERVDVVWDRYLKDSIKNCTRTKRGSGIRVKVSSKAKIPSKWNDFLRDSRNKEELFNFLSDEVDKAEWPENKEIYITKGTSVISKGGGQPVMECTHEEADTRVVVHLLDSLENGRKSIEIRTVDTDIVVILVGQFLNLKIHYPELDLWVAFGVGKNFRYIHINAICNNLGEDKSKALPYFHAFSGCDTTSCFNTKGKKSAYQAWKVYPDATKAFLHMRANPFQPFDCSSEHFQILEKLTIVMYDKSSQSHSVNTARKDLFSKKNRALENIPPTQNALIQHVKRVAFQGGIWTTCTESTPVIPSPEDWGWRLQNESWEPVWMTIPEAAKVCIDLIKCCCKAKRGCTICKCARSNLPCTDLCSCSCEK